MASQVTHSLYSWIAVDIRSSRETKPDTPVMMRSQMESMLCDAITRAHLQELRHQCNNRSQSSSRWGTRSKTV